MRSCQTPCAASGLPNATRLERRAQGVWHREAKLAAFAAQGGEDRLAAFGQADRTHAMVDAARSEPALRDLEAAALAQDQVLRRHPRVGEVDLHVAVRRVVVAEHRQRPQRAHSRGIDRHDQHRLLLVLVRGRIGLAHHDVERAVGIAGAGGKPLAPVHDIAVPVAPHRALHVGGVRAGDVRFGHQERRADRAVQQWLQPARLLRRAAVAFQHFHVAGVRRAAIEDFRGPQHLAHDLGQRRVVEVGEALGRAFALRQEQVPQPGGAGARLQLVDQADALPRIAGAAVGLDLGLETALVREDPLVEERLQASAQRDGAGRWGEVHDGILFP